MENNEFPGQDNIRNLKEKLPELQKKLKFGILLFVVVIIALSVAFGSAYVVPDGSEAVITMFGKHVDTKTSGLQFKIPYLQQKKIIDIQERHRIEWGFSTTRSGDSNRSPEYDRSSVTEGRLVVDAKDGSMSFMDVEILIDYRINNPHDYLYNVEDVEGTLGILAESIIRDVFPGITVDTVLKDKSSIDRLIKPELVADVKRYGLGIEILGTQIQTANLPGDVSLAYKKVETAKNEAKRLDEGSQSYRKTTMQKASADAAKIREDALMYASDIVTTATEDSADFISKYSQYKNSKTLTKEKLYMEAMLDLFSPENNNEFIIDLSKSGDIYKFYNSGNGAVSTDKAATTTN